MNTPVLDLYGNVTHIIHRVEDVTGQIRAEQQLVKAHRRQAFLLALSDCVRPLSDTDDIAAAASELLAKHLGVARVMYCEVDDSAKLMRVKRGWTSGQLESLEEAVFRLDDLVLQWQQRHARVKPLSLLTPMQMHFAHRMLVPTGLLECALS